MKSSEMTVGSVVYSAEIGASGPVVVLGFEGSKVECAVIVEGDQEVEYNPRRVSSRNILREFAPDCTSALAKIRTDRASRQANTAKEATDMADRKERIAVVLAKLAGHDLKSAYADSYARTISISLADIEVLLGLSTLNS